MSLEYAVTEKGYELHIVKKVGGAYRTYCGRRIFREVTAPEELADFHRVCWTCRRWAPPEEAKE
jgi:hypothetical protein